MTTLAIIPAHMTSTRFPGKVLADIEGKPMIERVVARVLRAKMVDTVVCGFDATPADLPLWNWAREQGVKHAISNHADKDLLTLFYKIADAYMYKIPASSQEAKTIVRITSDCPLIDPRIIDLCLSAHHQQRVDYTSNVYPHRTFPDGLDVEVFSFDALKQAYQEATDPADREHVTPWIQRNLNTFCVTSTPNLSHLRWTVDYPEDFIFVRQVYRDLKEPFGMKEILELEEQWTTTNSSDS